MRSSGLVLVVLAACGGGSKAPATTPSTGTTGSTDRPCVHAADHVIDLMSTEAKDAPPEKIKGVKDTIVRRCETDKWSAAMQTCVTEAKALGEIENCDSLLTPEQHEALSKESGGDEGAAPSPAPAAQPSKVMPAPKSRGPAKKSGDPCEGGE